MGLEDPYLNSLSSFSFFLMISESGNEDEAGSLMSVLKLNAEIMLRNQKTLLERRKLLLPSSLNVTIQLGGINGIMIFKCK